MIAVEQSIAVHCRGVTKTYGRGDSAVTALRGIDLDIHTDELLMLVGPSGCGKTTLISVMAGILDQDAGECRVFDHDFKQMPAREKTRYRGQTIGFVFQQFNLLPTLTAAENVSVPLLINGANRGVALKRAKEVLEQVGLADRAQSMPMQLSGGQQQRVAIARALVHEPKIIVCDEPTSALDHQTGHKVMELMRQVAMGHGRSLIIVTHDARIFEFADRIAQMDDGRIGKSGEIGEGTGAVFMIRKLFLPILAVIGFAWAIYVVRAGAQQPPAAQPVAQPAQAPFAAFVAGAGIVEAQSENIGIASLVSGVVTKVFVKYGDDVKAGDPLFAIDDRDLQADLAVKNAALLSAQAKLKRLQSIPRPEDVPPARAAVDIAQASLDDANSQYHLYLQVSDKGAIVQDDLNKRKFAVNQAQARLIQAKANLDELLAGTWGPDLDVAKADVASAQSQLESDQTMIGRLTMKAPIDGKLLQVKVHPGEFAPAGVMTQPLMMMGSVDRLVVRTDVDENDAWRVRPGAKAVAFVRGNREIKADLTFFRIEPYVIPKKSLTGDTAERVDTRVLQVLYTFERGDKPIYTGQQMDVFIDATEARTTDDSTPRH